MIYQNVWQAPHRHVLFLLRNKILIVIYLTHYVAATYIKRTTFFSLLYHKARGLMI